MRKTKFPWVGFAICVFFVWTVGKDLDLLIPPEAGSDEAAQTTERPEPGEKATVTLGLKGPEAVSGRVARVRAVATAANAKGEQVNGAVSVFIDGFDGPSVDVKSDGSLASGLDSSGWARTASPYSRVGSWQM